MPVGSYFACLLSNQSADCNKPDCKHRYYGLVAIHDAGLGPIPALRVLEKDL